MSIIKAIWAEEMERSKRIYESVQKIIEKLPKGSIQVKKNKGKEYHYLVWREGNKVKYKYIGNNSETLEKIKLDVNARKAYEKSQHERQKDIQLLEKALRLKIKGDK